MKPQRSNSSLIAPPRFQKYKYLSKLHSHTTHSYIHRNVHARAENDRSRRVRTRKGGTASGGCESNISRKNVSSRLDYGESWGTTPAPTNNYITSPRKLVMYTISAPNLGIFLKHWKLGRASLSPWTPSRASIELIFTVTFRPIKTPT